MASMRSTERYRSAAIVGFLLVVAVAAAGLASHRREVVLSASWAQGYASIADLRKAATLIVVGHVSGVVYEGEDVLSPGVATTRFSFVVERTIKGQSPETIVVKQSGGHLGGVVQRVEDDPRMAIGDTDVLYLSRISGGPYDGDYLVLGGPDGRLAVDSNGDLRSVGGVDLGGTTNVAEVQ